MKQRLTPLRQEILNILNNQKKPLNVNQLIVFLNMKADKSSIYRSLDFLKDQDYIQTMSFSGFTFYFTKESKGCGHFLSCKSCHEMVNVKECVSQKLQQELESRYHYQIHQHVLYFEGLCPDCQNIHKKRKLHTYN